MGEGLGHGESRALSVQGSSTSSAEPVAGAGDALWGEPGGRGVERGFTGPGGSEPGPREMTRSDEHVKIPLHLPRGERRAL